MCGTIGFLAVGWIEQGTWRSRRCRVASHHRSMPSTVRTSPCATGVEAGRRRTVITAHANLLPWDCDAGVKNVGRSSITIPSGSSKHLSPKQVITVPTHNKRPRSLFILHPRRESCGFILVHRLVLHHLVRSGGTMSPLERLRLLSWQA